MFNNAALGQMRAGISNIATARLTSPCQAPNTERIQKESEVFMTEQSNALRPSAEALVDIYRRMLRVERNDVDRMHDLPVSWPCFGR